MKGGEKEKGFFSSILFMLRSFLFPNSNGYGKEGGKKIWKEVGEKEMKKV